MVVGHSLGGVLLRAALNSLPPAVRRPRHLFLLGSPVQPSRFAQKLGANPVYRGLAGDCGHRLGGRSPRTGPGQRTGQFPCCIFTVRTIRGLRMPAVWVLRFRLRVPAYRIRQWRQPFPRAPCETAAIRLRRRRSTAKLAPISHDCRSTEIAGTAQKLHCGDLPAPDTAGQGPHRTGKPWWGQRPGSSKPIRKSGSSSPVSRYLARFKKSVALLPRKIDRVDGRDLELDYGSQSSAIIMQIPRQRAARAPAVLPVPLTRRDFSVRSRNSFSRDSPRLERVDLDASKAT